MSTVAELCLIHLFLGFACISYGRFIAVRFGFNLSTLCLGPLVIGRKGCTGGRFKRRVGWELITDSSRPMRKQSRTSVVSEYREVTVLIS